MEITEYEKLLSAGYRYVSFRPRSEKEITDFLQNTQINELLASILLYCEHLVNDAPYRVKRKPPPSQIVIYFLLFIEFRKIFPEI